MTTTTTTTTSTGAKVRIVNANKGAATAPAIPTGMDAIAAMVAAATIPAATIPAATIPAATIDPLAEDRAAFASALGNANQTTDRWTQNYAAALNEHLPADWWTFDHKAECADGKTVRREQKATYAVLKTAKYPNPSVAWKRVRNAAAKLKGWIDCETEEEEETTESDKAMSKYQKVQALIADAVKKLGNMDADHGAEMKALADIAKRLPSL
jgi:hypothetical protein